jgi:hypothetical protein
MCEPSIGRIEAVFYRGWCPQSEILVGAAGIEPATPGLEIPCSIQLSYAPDTQ